MNVVPVLLAALALLSVARAQGGVVYSPFTFAGPGDWQNWDLNQDGTVDFTLSHSWIISRDVPTSWMSFSYDIRPSVSSYVLGAGSYAAILSAGEEIALSTTPPNDWQRPQYRSLFVGGWSANLREGTWTGWKGPMENVQEGFLGLRFAASDGDHFGWLRVSKGGAGTLSVIVPVDFAWETQAGIPIHAGVVPEPSSLAMLVAGGILFLFFTRKTAQATDPLHRQCLRCPLPSGGMPSQPGAQTE